MYNDIVGTLHIPVKTICETKLGTRKITSINELKVNIHLIRPWNTRLCSMIRLNATLYI